MNELTANSNKSSYIWMGVSGILLILLIISLIVNPFGKGSGGMSDVVATVNGTKITKNQLYEEMYRQGGSSLLDSLITEELINQEAKKSNITITDADIDAELERQAAASDMTVDDMIQMFVYYYGYTEEDVRKIGSQQPAIRKILSPQINITDEDIQTYYDENVDQFTTPEQVRVSHILVETEEEALEIVSELNKGADFAKLAEERSTDTGTAAKGGDTDYFARGRMVQIRGCCFLDGGWTGDQAAGEDRVRLSHHQKNRPQGRIGGYPGGIARQDHRCPRGPEAV